MKMFCSKIEEIYHLSPKWEIHEFKYEVLYKLLPRYTETRHMLLKHSRTYAYIVIYVMPMLFAGNQRFLIPDNKSVRALQWSADGPGTHPSLSFVYESSN